MSEVKKVYRFALYNNVGELNMSTEVDAPDPTIDLDFWKMFLSNVGCTIEYLGEFEEEVEEETIELNMTYKNKVRLALYISEYIQEELDRGLSPAGIDTVLISRAIEAFEGGA